MVTRPHHRKKGTLTTKRLQDAYYGLGVEQLKSEREREKYYYLKLVVGLEHDGGHVMIRMGRKIEARAALAVFHRFKEPLLEYMDRYNLHLAWGNITPSTANRVTLEKAIVPPSEFDPKNPDQEIDPWWHVYIYGMIFQYPTDSFNAHASAINQLFLLYPIYEAVRCELRNEPILLLDHIEMCNRITGNRRNPLLGTK